MLNTTQLGTDPTDIDEAFSQELLEQMRGGLGEHHFGPERQRSAAAQAEAVIAAALESAPLKKSDLRRRRKGNSWKMALAERLRLETAVTIKWVAKRMS